MGSYTFTQVGMTCDQCGRHEEWPSFKEARDTHGWSFGEDRDEPNDPRDLCADCFEEARQRLDQSTVLTTVAEC